MTTYEILYWHGIPTGVKATDADGDAVEHLPSRFQAAVDTLSMKTGLTDYESYLAGWVYSAPENGEGTRREVAGRVAAELVEAYPHERVQQIVRAKSAELSVKDDRGGS